MTEIKYTKDHQWLRLEDDGTAVVGITDYAQEQLGDVVFVELPAVGTAVARDAQVAQVESVKSAGEVMAPVGGTVVEVNTALDGEPGTINTDPAGAGWFFKLKLADPTELDGLLDEAAYQAHLATLG
jgi:glycine cleavage system H protein